MPIVIGPRFTIKNIEPAAVRSAPTTQRKAFWNAASAFVAMAKEIELRNGLDRHGDPLAAIAKYTREHRHSEMGAADPFAPPLQPAHGLSRTRSLFRAQPTARLDGVTCFWGYDAVTAESWGKMLAIHRTGGPRLPPRDVIGLSKASVAEVKKRAAAWWKDYVKSEGAVPVPAFAPELEPTPAPKFKVERVPKYKPQSRRAGTEKAPGAPGPKEPHRISQIKINGRVYTMGSGTAADVRRGIANKTFSGFGQVVRMPDGTLVRVTSEELQGKSRGYSISAQEAIARRGAAPAPAAKAPALPARRDLPAAAKPKVAILGKPAELRKALKTQAPKVRVAHLPDLVGAKAGAKVQALVTLKGQVNVQAAAPDYETRILLAGKAMRITHLDVPLAKQGKGIGGGIMKTIIAAAEQAELEQITMTAARAADQVGYKVWPKFGFDAPLPAAIIRKLPEALRGAKTVADLYKTAAGRAWWEKHGVTIDLTLEL
jgi:hypothetical protein